MPIPARLRHPIRGRRVFQAEVRTAARHARLVTGEYWRMIEVRDAAQRAYRVGSSLAQAKGIPSIFLRSNSGTYNQLACSAAAVANGPWAKAEPGSAIG